MKLRNSRGNFLSERAPRQADLSLRQPLIFHLSDVQHRTALHSKPTTGPSADCKTTWRHRFSICWDGHIPSLPTHPRWTITKVDQVCCTPCVWCRFVVSLLWRGSEMLEVNGNHPTTSPRCYRGSVKEMSSA